MSKATNTTCSQPELHLIGEIVVRFGNLEMFVATVIPLEVNPRPKRGHSTTV